MNVRDEFSVHIPKCRAVLKTRMATLPGEDGEDRTVITDGYFEREVNLSRAVTATFLRELADQVEAGNDLTI
jgi:hypothetical protein